MNCVVCHRRADAYFCEACAWDSDYVRGSVMHDRRSSTATTIARALQRRVDQAAAYEQHLQLQTTAERKFWTGDERERSRKLCAMRTFQSPGVTREELQRIEDRMPARVGPLGTLASVRLRRLARRAARQATRKAA